MSYYNIVISFWFIILPPSTTVIMFVLHVLLIKSLLSRSSNIISTLINFFEFSSKVVFSSEVMTLIIRGFY